MGRTIHADFMLRDAATGQLTRLRGPLLWLRGRLKLMQGHRAGVVGRLIWRRNLGPGLGPPWTRDGVWEVVLLCGVRLQWDHAMRAMLLLRGRRCEW